MRVRQETLHAAARLITAGLRALAKQAHPDMGGSNAEMQAINGAADWLRDSIGAGGGFKPFEAEEHTHSRASDATIEPYGVGTISTGRVRCMALGPVDVMRTTAKAILIAFRNEDLWFPLSQIAEESEVPHLKPHGQLVVSLWIAEQKGLM